MMGKSKQGEGVPAPFIFFHVAILRVKPLSRIEGFIPSESQKAEGYPPLLFFIFARDHVESEAPFTC